MIKSLTSFRKAQDGCLVQLGDAAVNAIVRFITTGEDLPVSGAEHASAPKLSPKYGIDGYNKFLDPDGYPAITPPWGTLNAINLHTGEYAWKIPFGEIPYLAAKGLPNTGSENYGGSVVTAGDLLFDRWLDEFRSSVPRVRQAQRQASMADDASRRRETRPCRLLRQWQAVRSHCSRRR